MVTGSGEHVGGRECGDVDVRGYKEQTLPEMARGEGELGLNQSRRNSHS